MQFYESGGSASILALVSAVKMGFSKIVLAGVSMKLLLEKFIELNKHSALTFVGAILDFFNNSNCCNAF